MNYIYIYDLYPTPNSCPHVPESKHGSTRRSKKIVRIEKEASYKNISISIAILSVS